jgi:outer membrane protein
MRAVLITAWFFIIVFPELSAQEKWNLRSCVEYAMKNNGNVKRSELQSLNTRLNYEQSKYAIYPGANLGMSSAFNSGNNQDPTTFSRVTENYLSAGMQLQSSADIFNFYSKKNTISANNLSVKAAEADVNKIKNDIALSTANAYLQILLAKEQEKISLVQLNQTREQLSRTRKLVDAGALPELNATQLEAQLAMDSGNVVSAKGNVALSILSIKSLMNLDAGAAFDVETPPVDKIPLEPIADLQPEYVYTQALQNQPQQIGNEYRMKAALKNADVAKASRYPTLSAFASLSSNYLSFSKKPIYNKVLSGYQSTGLIVNTGSATYDVQAPVLTNGDVLGYYKPNSFSTQLKDNFRKSLGLSLNVPIFNGYNAQLNIKRSNLNIKTIELQKEQDDLKLKQDIYQAYTAAVTALQKYQASLKAVDASEKTYSFAEKRHNIGALSTFDLITSQNNLLRARLELTINQVDYVFKMKVLEFYKGAGLKL